MKLSLKYLLFDNASLDRVSPSTGTYNTGSPPDEKECSSQRILLPNTLSILFFNSCVVITMNQIQCQFHSE